MTEFLPKRPSRKIGEKMSKNEMHLSKKKPRFPKDTDYGPIPRGLPVPKVVALKLDLEAAIYRYENAFSNTGHPFATRTAKKVVCGPSTEQDFKLIFESRKGLALEVSDEITDDRWFVMGD